MQKTSVYSAILGKPVKTVQRRKQQFMFLDDEHLLGVDDSVALSLAAPRKRARRSRTAAPSLALEDDADNAGGVMAEAMPDAAEASDDDHDDNALPLDDPSVGGCGSGCCWLRSFIKLIRLIIVILILWLRLRLTFVIFLELQFILRW
ncbi:unnamed protein product [Symbiodinium sp. CCMP2592]|nr:unnamed protein product [Symbiodinium sp. CCMP2592]